jgi:prefoldin subunit 5
MTEEKANEIMGLGEELYDKAQEIHALESEINGIISQLNSLMGTKEEALYINHSLDTIENFASEAQEAWEKVEEDDE